MAEKKADQPDPKMLKYLDLLINMDVLENEEDWDTIENLSELDGSEVKDANEDFKEFEEFEDES